MMIKKIGYVMAVVLVCTFAACKTAPKQLPTNEGAAAPPPSANNVAESPVRSTVRDWQDRNMGETAHPAWLKELVVNNRHSVVIQEFSLTGNPQIRNSQAERSNREEARVLADLMFAQAIANELKRYVITAAASRLDSGQMDIVEQITNSTKVTLTGAQKVKDFWQYIEKEDAGVKSRSYIWYTIYSFPGDTWSQITRKYVNDVIGQIPNRPVQQQIADSFAEIDADAKRNQERSDAEFRQQLELQRKAVEDLQKQQMARINQQTATNAAVTEAARAQAEADARARYAAYRSGNPAVAAAASVTANDIDWISALSTSASVLAP